MKKRMMSVVAVVLVFALCFSAVPEAKADSTEVKPFIAFGADLNAKEKAAVMKLFQITNEELADYTTIEVTDADEHEYLDDYLAASVIGKRALSSVMIEEKDKGSGIEVETHNISFCTKEMYTNALVTAGIEDAQVIVAGPFKISGTAALVGAMKAYAAMTGDEINENQSDAAMNELVLTGELGDTIGKEEAANFVATLKDKVLSEDLSSQEDILKAIDETAEKYDIQLTQDMKDQLASLMQKIGGLDLDIDSIQQQAQGVYEKIKDMGIDLDEAKGILGKITDFFKGLWESIKNIFS